MQLLLVTLKSIHCRASLACCFTPSENWGVKDREIGRCKEDVSYSETDGWCDRILPNVKTVFLIFNRSCETKTRISMRGMELRGELNGNAERMWQSYHENTRTTEHQAYSWFNQKWYGSNPYVRSEKQKSRWQELHNQVISHGHHPQTPPWGAGWGNNREE